MGKKKKQEKSRKQKDKLRKQEKAGQKAAGAEKDKNKKKNAGAEKKDRVQEKTETSAKLAAKRRSGKASGGNLTRAAECFRALGDENRLRILALLGDGELCAGDILKSMSIVQSTLSHHMKILVESGIVRCRRQGKWSYYSVDEEMRERLGDLTGQWAAGQSPEKSPD